MRSTTPHHPHPQSRPRLRAIMLWLAFTFTHEFSRSIVAAFPLPVLTSLHAIEKTRLSSKERSLLSASDFPLLSRTNGFQRTYLPKTSLLAGLANDPSLIETNIAGSEESGNIESDDCEASGKKLQSTIISEAHGIVSHLVSTLDLDPLITHTATYACTKRGKEAILSLTRLPSSSSSSSLSLSTSNRDRKSRRSAWFSENERFRQKYSNVRMQPGINGNDLSVIAPIAKSASEATAEYELVRQAMEILRSQQDVNGDSFDDSKNREKLRLPPMFRLRSRLVDIVSTTATTTSGGLDSDDDEWINTCINPLPPGVDLFEEIDLESVLQAEQVVKLLLDTYQWAIDPTIQDNFPGLVDIILKMDSIEGRGDKAITESRHALEDKTKRSDVSILIDLYNTLKGTVEIVRAGPNLSDPYNRFSYQFRLVSGDDRLEELDTLRRKEQQILDRSRGKDFEKNGKLQQQLAIVRAEMSALEHHITRRLITAMIRAAPAAQRGMNALARLDVVFSRAAFGCEWNGKIPIVENEGRIVVEGFMHPVLALEKSVVAENETRTEATNGRQTVVPVDLKMPGKEGYKGLIISGPNAGGKTLALKSFGLAATMVKLGLPIPISKVTPNVSVVVDYFHDITVEVGDNQSLKAGESTLMARLNACSSLIKRISAPEVMDMNSSKLILFDELGGGTDPVAGASIAQAILEKILSTDHKCNIVATTHSPQLKVLSLNDDRFQCASVLLSSADYNESVQNNGGKATYLKPTYRLSYGTTGESYALGAASRCRPSLPVDVINRAAELMSGGEDQAGKALQNHLLALERERNAAMALTKKSEMVWKEVQDMKHDMIAKLDASETQLARLESRLKSIFDVISSDKTGDIYELVGGSLSELRAVRKIVKSEKELLAERGLRRVSSNHSFRDGEAVVITAEGEWDGCNAFVQLDDDNNDPFTVTVVPSVDWFASTEENISPTLVLKRSDIAVWDYPDEMWKFDEKIPKGNQNTGPNQKVLSILSTLKPDRNSSKASSVPTENRSAGSFTSARQRKAAAAGIKSANKKSKRNKKR